MTTSTKIITTSVSIITIATTLTIGYLLKRSRDKMISCLRKSVGESAYERYSK